MNNKPRNPSAFPKTKTAGDVSIAEGGMTLRDYFAASVAAECLRTASKHSYYGLDGANVYDLAATDAYALADAMLAEREREQ